jgi:hypothetical protein
MDRVLASPCCRMGGNWAREGKHHLKMLGCGNDVVLVPADVVVLLITTNIAKRAPVEIDLFFNAPE